jgi:uncharacterized protein (DUF433 family)
MNAKDVINIDKDILGGTPVFKGTRVPVKSLFDYLKAGDSLDDFHNDFDYIPKESCIAVLNICEKLIIKSIIDQEIIIKKKPSDFRGALKLTDEQYQDFQKHLKDVRNEWDRDI